MKSGREYVLEGRRLARVVFPDRKSLRRALPRLTRLSQRLLRSKDDRRMSLGFFLHGVAEAGRSRRGA